MILLKTILTGAELSHSEVYSWILDNLKSIDIREAGQNNVYRFASSIVEMKELRDWIKDRKVQEHRFHVTYNYE